MSHPSVPAEARPGLWREVGEYTAVIHRITGEKFGRIKPDGTVNGGASWAEVFGEMLADICGKARDAGVITVEQFDAALQYYWDHRTVFDEVRTPTLVHWDIWDPNILVRQRNGSWHVQAIIDADRALYADREFEFVLWDTADADMLAAYGTPLDMSDNAVLRRKIYRMQLYMIYAWFYLVALTSPDFQAYSKGVVMEVMGELMGQS
jgi:aminoglycoside phosphotransferase (APT) family kinase protein